MSGQLSRIDEPRSHPPTQEPLPQQGFRVTLIMPSPDRACLSMAALVTRQKCIRQYLSDRHARVRGRATRPPGSRTTTQRGRPAGGSGRHRGDAEPGVQGVTAQRVARVDSSLTEVRGQLVPDRPKTAAGVRSVPLPRTVAATLEPAVADLDDAFVFSGADGPPIRAGSFRARFWKAVA